MSATRRPVRLAMTRAIGRRSMGTRARRESVRGGTVYLSEGDLCSACAATVRGRIGAIERADASREWAGRGREPCISV